ncbi:MAG: hypothetical protein C00003105_01584 [ANME-2 cluster archaeon HR1]|nr:MAG: hypothetical protein C00003105_01584 [ANME-2 cluster archaeon HR1]
MEQIDKERVLIDISKLQIAVIHSDVQVTGSVCIILQCIINFISNSDVLTFDNFNNFIQAVSGSIDRGIVKRVTDLCDINRSVDRCIGEIDDDCRIT